MRWIRERLKLGQGVRRKRRDSWAWGFHHNRGSAPFPARQPLWREAPRPLGKRMAAAPTQIEAGGLLCPGAKGMGVSCDGWQFLLEELLFLCLPLNLFSPSLSELYYLIARFLQSGPCNKSAQVRERGGALGAVGNGTNGEIEAAGCAVPLRVRKGRPWLVLPSVIGFPVGREEWVDSRSCSSYPCFPFAQVLVQELEEHQVRAPARRGGEGWGETGRRASVGGQGPGRRLGS